MALAHGWTDWAVSRSPRSWQPGIVLAVPSGEALLSTKTKGEEEPWDGLGRVMGCHLRLPLLAFQFLGVLWCGVVGQPYSTFPCLGEGNSHPVRVPA